MMNDFVTKWDTSLTAFVSSSKNQVSLPSILEGIYNFEVQWGDGNSQTITTASFLNDNSIALHTYENSGINTVVISGVIQGWSFWSIDNVNYSGDRVKLLEIIQWIDRSKRLVL